MEMGSQMLHLLWERGSLTSVLNRRKQLKVVRVMLTAKGKRDDMIDLELLAE